MVKSVIYVTTGPLLWSQKYEKFKDLLSGNREGWQFLKELERMGGGSGKADQGN